MLPDLRVVTIAVVSTFLFAVSAGFYTSARLASERKPRPETLAAIEENPLSRIALNWPEPVQPAQDALDLDFAVAAKGPRNPVRDVTDEIAAAPAPEPKVAAAPQIVEAPKAEVPAVEAPAVKAPAVEAPAVEPAAPKVAVPQIEAMPAPIAAPAKQEDDIPTASIAAPPPVEPQSVNPPVDAAAPEAQAAPQAPAAQVASRPEPEAPEAHPMAEDAAAVAKPADVKPAKKAAKKKRVARKRARPIVRVRPRIAASPAPSSSFSLFGTRR